MLLLLLRIVFYPHHFFGISSSFFVAAAALRFAQIRFGLTWTQRLSVSWLRKPQIGLMAATSTITTTTTTTTTTQQTGSAGSMVPVAQGPFPAKGADSRAKKNDGSVPHSDTSSIDKAKVDADLETSVHTPLKTSAKCMTIRFKIITALIAVTVIGGVAAALVVFMGGDAASASPSSPPPVPAGMVEEHQLVVTFTAAGSADDYQEGSAASLQVKTALATTANVDANKVCDFNCLLSFPPTLSPLTAYSSSRRLFCSFLRTGDTCDHIRLCQY